MRSLRMLKVSEILETKLEKLNRIRERISHKLSYFPADVSIENISVLVTYKEFLLLDALARESAELIAENRHLEYRLNDGIWNDFKKSQEIWELERKLLVEQNKRLMAEIERLNKDKEVQ